MRSKRVQKIFPSIGFKWEYRKKIINEKRGEEKKVRIDICTAVLYYWQGRFIYFMMELDFPFFFFLDAIIKKSGVSGAVK